MNEPVEVEISSDESAEDRAAYARANGFTNVRVEGDRVFATGKADFSKVQHFRQAPTLEQRRTPVDWKNVEQDFMKLPWLED